MDFEIREAPALEGRHVRHARVLSTRVEILDELGRDLVFVEVGVALGDFTRAVLQSGIAARFVAIDMFDMERWPHTWGGRVGLELAGRSHRQFYEEVFAEEIKGQRLIMMVGDSVTSLGQLEPASADVIYLDSDHSYEHVCAELEVAKEVIKPGGTIIMNDYTFFDPYRGMPYGVVQATNEFMIREGWEMTFFALQPQMFCDVALRKMEARD